MEELSDKFLTQISKDKKITKARAAEMTDLCMRLTSAQLGVEYSDVYNTIYSEAYLTSCLKSGKFCSDLELEECAKNCQCVQFEGKCYPRYFEDAKLINEDPDKYVETNGPNKGSIPTEKLLHLVKLASYLYYNYEGGGLTDNSFDALEYHLNKRLKLRGRRYEKIGAPPIDKIRAPLPYPMASLDKVKPGSRDLLDFITQNVENGLLWSLKLDGVSGLVIYSAGKLKKIYTRGDGVIGGDVTYLKDYIKFPDLSGKIENIVVRGEFILPKTTWIEKYQAKKTEGVAVETVATKTFHGAHSNARSFVSAKINSGHVSQGLNDIVFVAYEIVDLPPSSNTTSPSGAEIPRPSESFELLAKLGFNVVQHGLFKTPTVFDIVVLYKDVRSSALTQYYIDGLVLTHNIPKTTKNPHNLVQGTAPSNPKNSVAFKMRLEEQIRKTRVLYVEWRKTRYGKLFPVVIFESVYIDGARLHKASGHNAAHIRDWSMGKGTVIKVTRSGDVIPTIVDVEVNDKIEAMLPNAALTGKWHWKGQDIVLDDPDNDRTVQIKRIEHFFETIGVPRIREKTIEKLWDAGMKDIRSITNAKPSDLIKIRGIGAKTSESHYKNIHEVMKNTRMDRYIPASTAFGLGIGRKLVKVLMRYHPTVLSEDSEMIARMLKKKKIPGFGEKRIENIANNVPKFREFLFSLSKDDIEYAMRKDEERREKIKAGNINPLVRGKTFVFTGFYGHLDLDLEDYIYDNLGNFSDVVTSGTSAVVAANVMESSKKMIEAQKLNVKVLSLQEFMTAYKIPRAGEEDDENENAKLGIRPEGEDE